MRKLFALLLTCTVVAIIATVQSTSTVVASPPLENHIVYATADASTNINDVSTNYGSSEELQLQYKNDDYNRWQTYLKFSLLGFPAMEQITGAWLKLYVSDIFTTNDQIFRYCDVSYNSGTGFIESALTWDNQDTQAADLGELRSNGKFMGSLGWITIPLNENTFRSWYDNGKLYLVVLIRVSPYVDDFGGFNSKEYGGGSRWPQLIVEYEPLVEAEWPVIQDYDPSFAGKLGDNYAITCKSYIENMKDETVVLTKYIITNPGESITQDTSGVWNSGWLPGAFGENGSGWVSVTSPNVFIENHTYVYSAWYDYQYLGVLSVYGPVSFMPRYENIIISPGVIKDWTIIDMWKVYAYSVIDRTWRSVENWTNKVNVMWEREWTEVENWTVRINPPGAWIEVENWTCEMVGIETYKEPYEPPDIGMLITAVIIPMVVIFLPALVLSKDFKFAGFMLGLGLGVIMAAAILNMGIGLVLLLVIVLVVLYWRER